MDVLCKNQGGRPTPLTSQVGVGTTPPTSGVTDWYVRINPSFGVRTCPVIDQERPPVLLRSDHFQSSAMGAPWRTRPPETVRPRPSAARQPSSTDISRD